MLASALLAATAVGGEYSGNGLPPTADAPVVAATTDAIARCNVHPGSSQVQYLAFPAGQTPTQFRARFNADAGYRARFEPIALRGEGSDFVVLESPPLDEQALVTARLAATGEFRLVAPNGPVCGLPPPDSIGRAVEYRNTLLDHYFLTASTAEQAAIDAGRVGPGWVRTGLSFAVILQPGCDRAAEGGFHPVYRFAGIPGVGPNSHFFTVSQTECAIVRDRTDWGWFFEGVPFWAAEPRADGCAAPYPSALYRAYNDGKGGIPNHRYATSRTVIGAMVDQGWIDEGVAMCLPDVP